MTGLMHFLAMGGYAQYVWPSFGFALVILLAHPLLYRRWHRRLLSELRRRHSVEDAG